MYAAVNCSEPIPKDLYIYNDHWFTFKFERDFKYCDWWPWMVQFFQTYIPSAIVAYIILIFGIRRIMKNRKPFDLKVPLILWNATLAIFSTMGAIRMLPEVFATWQRYGINGTICNDGARYGVSGLWFMLFIFSKLPEFVDTLFIVLRKKPLIFLHYYHHIETCLFSFWGYTLYTPCSRWAVVMNYPVHSLMYTYYTLRALNLKVPRAVAMSITLMQTGQMFVGMFGAVEVFRADCGNDWNAMYATVATYSVYAYLFSKFFYQSYFAQKPAKSGLDANGNAQREKAD